jgi:hypothetical protein
MKCCSCGADLGFDDDPYADPDCPECLRRSVEADLLDDEYEASKVPLWASDWHDE